jgi:hypothetical protein
MVTTGGESLDEDEIIDKEQKNRDSNIFTNTNIDKHMNYPRDLAHEDYKYLITSAGPLVAG